MGTTAQKLQAIADSKADIKAAINGKGVPVDDTVPFLEYGNKIRQIPTGGAQPNLQTKSVNITQNGTTDVLPDANFDALSKVTVNVNVPTGGGGSGGYTRPADRPVKPVLNDNEVYWLFGVREASPNDMAMLAQVSAGTYTVNWGDGITTTHNSNTLAEHIYDYASISATPDSRGYKMVWIKLTPTTAGANITQVNTNQRPSTRPAASTVSIYAPQVFEFYVRASKMAVLNFGTSTLYNRYYNCEIFGLQENSLTTSGAHYMCQYMYNLQQIDDLDINSIPAGITGFMRFCQSFNGKFPSGVTFANVATYFMAGCAAYNQPFSAGVTFANATAYFMQNCSSFNQPLSISRATTAAFGTNSFNGMSSLASLRIHNWQGAANNSITISYNSMSRDALVAFFNDFPNTISGTNTVNITDCVGTASLTAEDRAILTNKGYTITG